MSPLIMPPDAAALFLSLPFIVMVLFWTGRAIRTRAACVPHVGTGPLCEGCGYDLTHTSGAGVCTECGLALDVSLLATGRRTHRPWAPGDGLQGWFRESWRIIRGGRRYYGMLQLVNAPEVAARFAGFHILGICLAAPTWLTTAVILVSADSTTLAEGWKAFALGILLASFLVPMIGVATHRVIALLVSVPWFARGMFPNPACAGRVLYRETCFLWVFCAYNGLLISSFMLFQDWLTKLFGWRFWNVLLGAPTEPIAILVGNGLLCLFWARRIHRAFLAVRWANF